MFDVIPLWGLSVVSEEGPIILPVRLTCAFDCPSCGKRHTRTVADLYVSMGTVDDDFRREAPFLVTTYTDNPDEPIELCRACVKNLKRAQELVASLKR